jgi:hypothetical protein
MLRSDMIGAVCVFGGLFVMSRMSLFCVLISGCMYVFLSLSVPQMVIAPMR